MDPLPVRSAVTNKLNGKNLTPLSVSTNGVVFHNASDTTPDALGIAHDRPYNTLPVCHALTLQPPSFAATPHLMLSFLLSE